MFFWFQAWNHFFINSRRIKKLASWTLKIWNHKRETTRLRAINGAVSCLTFSDIIIKLDERISTLQKSLESEQDWLYSVSSKLRAQAARTELHAQATRTNRRLVLILLLSVIILFCTTSNIVYLRVTWRTLIWFTLTFIKFSSASSTSTLFSLLTSRFIYVKYIAWKNLPCVQSLKRLRRNSSDFKHRMQYKFRLLTIPSSLISRC